TIECHERYKKLCIPVRFICKKHHPGLLGADRMKQTDENGGEEGRRSARPFPKFTLEECLEVPVAIQDKNAGKPLKRLFLAEAINRKPASSDFKSLLSSSNKYGLIS